MGPGGVQQDACTRRTQTSYVLYFYLVFSYTQKKSLFSQEAMR